MDTFVDAVDSRCTRGRDPDCSIVADGTSKQSWYLTRRFRLTVLIVIAIVFVVEGYVAIFVRGGDFEWHRNFGLNFLDGMSYEPLGNHYPTFRAMIDVPIAVAPKYVARASCYIIAVLTTFLCFGLWTRMAPVPSGARAEEHSPLQPYSFAAVAVTLGITLAYLLRDLDDCGSQLFLLFLMTMGVWCAYHNRSIWSGLWFAMAALYKTTPVLMLLFLLWKRKWVASASMVAFTFALYWSPLMFLEHKNMMASHDRFMDRLTQVVASEDPMVNYVQENKHQNQSLIAALARYLMTVEQDHYMHLDHRGFVQFGQLEPHSARRVIVVILFVFGCLLAWQFRITWSNDPPDQRQAIEWAIATLLCALASPMCWKQHLVLAVPLIYLIMRTWLISRNRPRWVLVMIIIAACMIVLSKRFIATRELGILLMSYKTDTISLLSLIFVGLFFDRSRPHSIPRSQPAAEETEQA